MLRGISATWVASRFLNFFAPKQMLVGLMALRQRLEFSLIRLLVFTVFSAGA